MGSELDLSNRSLSCLWFEIEREKAIGTSETQTPSFLRAPISFPERVEYSSFSFVRTCEKANPTEGTEWKHWTTRTRLLKRNRSFHLKRKKRENEEIEKKNWIRNQFCCFLPSPSMISSAWTPTSSNSASDSSNGAFHHQKENRENQKKQNENRKNIEIEIKINIKIKM